MTTRNLDALFAPTSIALVGASDQAGSVGAVLAANLLAGGFRGPVLPVNPHARSIGATLAYPSVGALPLAPDLAVVATPAPTVPTIVHDLAELGCRAAVVISAGFSGADGAPLRKALLEAARPKLLRVLGPNCLGFLSPRQGLNASFAHLAPAPGGLALVAQSGAIATSAIDWAWGRGIGFSHIATLGDIADIDFGDMLDFLATDGATKAIVLYVEAITDARKFMSAARRASRLKPVVVIKAGRSPAGAKAAFSHTGALAGADAVYDAAFRRAGMLRVRNLRELFDAAALLTGGLQVDGERLAILTNGGGAGVLAVDALSDVGGLLAPLDEALRRSLDQVLPATWSHANPIDIIGDASPERYRRALAPLLASRAADAVLVMNCPTAMADGAECARAVIETASAAPDRPPVLTCWLGGPAAEAPRRLFGEAGFPTHETPDEAVGAFAHLVEHRRNQGLLMEAPPAGPADIDHAAAGVVLEAAGREGRTQLTEPEAKALLAAYGVPVLPSRLAATPRQAAEAAAAMAPPYALKVQSPDIVHKSEAGGVALNLATPEAVEAAAVAMAARIGREAAAVRLDGFLVQSFVSRPKARELIVGLASDPVFGPIVLFGDGGTAVETLGDRVLGLPPINRPLARDMIARTRVSRLLAGYRDVPAADIEAVAQVIERIALLALDWPQIGELDINPLVVDADGVLALDARARLTDAPIRPALRPYPAELATHIVLDDGARIGLRPIIPSDGTALAAMMGAGAPQDVQLRFHAAMEELPNDWAARLSQIDFDREMAFVAIAGQALVGVSRLASDPEGETAEIALMVRNDWQDRGLGRRLLERLVTYARDRGLTRLWGDVQAGNDRMLDLGRRLGFDVRPVSDGLARIDLTLSPTAA